MSRSALLTTLESASYAPARPRPLPRDLGIPTYIMRAFTQVTTTVGVLRPLSVVVLCGVAHPCTSVAPLPAHRLPSVRALRPGPGGARQWGQRPGSDGSCVASWVGLSGVVRRTGRGAVAGARSPVARGGPTDGHCRAGLALGGAGAGRRVRGVLNTCRSARDLVRCRC